MEGDCDISQFKGWGEKSQLKYYSRCRHQDSTWQGHIYLLHNSSFLTTGTMIECQVQLENTSYLQTRKMRYKKGKHYQGQSSNTKTIPLFLGHPQQLLSVQNTCPAQSGYLSYGMLTISWLFLKIQRKWKIESYSLVCFCLCLTTLLFITVWNTTFRVVFTIFIIVKVLMLIWI